MQTNFINQYVVGDCKDILANAPSNIVDLIITSPPYADNRKNTYAAYILTTM